MLVQDALLQGYKAFSAVWPAETASVVSRELLAHLLQRSPASVEAHLRDPLPPSIARRLPNLLKRAQSGEPLAYLVGSAPFLQHTFKVSRSTLIPRPETEELVHHVLQTWKPTATDTIAIDIGTGSGCIAVSLAAARSPEAVIASDVSRRALRIAKHNAETILGTRAKSLSFLQTPLFSRALQQVVEKHHPKQLFLVANLPYLPHNDRQALHTSVTAFEPARALYADDQGNALILRCLRQLRSFLTRHSSLACTAWFEFDPPQATALEQTARALFPTAFIHVLNDENGRSRFLEIAR